VDVTGGLSPSISGVSANNPLVAFYDIKGRNGRGSYTLSRTPHETYIRDFINAIYYYCQKLNFTREINHET
jgi:hypothetical protein